MKSDSFIPIWTKVYLASGPGRVEQVQSIVSEEL